MNDQEAERFVSLITATLQNIHDTQREQIALAKETKVVLERMHGLLEDANTHGDRGTRWRTAGRAGG